MKIHIVNYEYDKPWILTKIAENLVKSLRKLGHEVSISKKIEPDAEVYHHITHHSYQPTDNSGTHTVMITHIDNIAKLEKIKKDLKTAKVGICMSKATMNELIKLGLPKEQLQFANMAHDGLAKPRKIAIGLTTRLYPDGRKNEKDFLKILEYIQPTDFRFEIMGYGWQEWVEKMRNKGFEVTYEDDFNYNNYMSLLSRLDYYLYLGEDEGSAGFIDALAAGVKTIVQPQGFHLDAPNGITHSFTNFSELKSIFIQICEERKQLVKAVSEWTWDNYAKKHLNIWEKCLNNELMDHSEEINNIFEDTIQNSSVNSKKFKLLLNYFKHKILLVYNLRNRAKFPENGGKFFKHKTKS